VKSFGVYYLEKELQSNSVLLESTDLDELYSKGVLKGRKKALKSFLETLKNKYVKIFYNKFPKIQYEDIQEAFDETIKKILEEKPKTQKKIEQLFKKNMHQNLSAYSKRKKDFKKNLSCLKSVKMTNQSIKELMRRSERLLTSQEKKIIEMCSQGKTVRAMAKEINLSPATTWRVLNIALDKIRLSHGIKSRKLG